MLEIVKQTIIWGKRRLYFLKGEPLYGYIGFGVIDRGTNVLQVRPTTICPLNCIFCSVDAGPKSKNRVAEFMIDHLSIYNATIQVAKYKGGGIEALIDTIGEPFTYPHLVDLVKLLKNSVFIRSVAVETHGALLSKEIINKLEEAGLDRINLSIDTLDKEKAKYLQGTSWYNLDKVIELAEYIVKNTKIDLHVTPVWVPRINDEDVINVIKWAYNIGAGKKWPPATIQKYNIHKYGRKVPGIKPLTWSNFWKEIKKIEEETGVRVTWTMDEWGMRRTKRYPCPYSVGDKVVAEVLFPGVFKGEYIGVIKDRRGKWLVTIPARRIKIGTQYMVEIISDKDSLLIARIIGKL